MFESLAAKLIAGAVACLLLFGAGTWTGYRLELGKYNGLVAADAKALTKATQEAAAKQKRIDDSNQVDAVAAAYFKGKMDATTITLKTEAPANVTITQDAQAAAADSAGCVTFGFARLLYAGAHGVTPDSLNIPGGESVDACTALKPSDLASAVAQDLAAGYSNGHQLDSLIGAIGRNQAIVGDRPVSPGP